MSEAIYAMPDMTKKVKFDRSEAEERIVDIYVSADTLRDHETSTKTEDVEHTSTNGPGDQHTEPDSTGKRPFLAVAVCLGLLCVLLLAGIIGQSVHCRQQTRYNLSKERDQLQREKDDLMEKFSNLSRKRFESCWYFVSTEKKTWSESRKDCLERGADLVIINSKKEMRFLYGLKKRVWIGLTDRETEGSWKWVDGTPLKTGFWGSKQPSSGGGHSTHQEKDCVELDDGQHQPEKTWNDSNCDNKLEWICELCNKNLL
ncbi:C-type lectin domain family 4 member E isoform X1 [Salmo salar]|uniref:C-type lectin domain family 4 member E isoform X1 n=1 Tax=Salmo salar TaxID=8030 RepID=A0A1S3RFL8_SALSA|nr:C-type lectin domain family 4 member E-like isoform X1 [Salmo salar]